MGILSSKTHLENLLGSHKAGGKPEALVEAYQATVKAHCFSPTELQILETIYNKVAPTSSPWSINEFTSFLSTSFPSSPAQEIFQDAAPILFRMACHSGAYPYHLSPKSTTTLSLPALRKTIASMVGRDNYYLRPRPVEVPPPEFAEQMEKRGRRLLYQSLAIETGISRRERIDRDVEDQRQDEDLDDAMEIVNRDAERNGRRVPFPSKARLPSSWSFTRSRGVHAGEAHGQMRSLVRLVLACALYAEGIGPEMVCEDLDALEDAVKKVMGGFGDEQKLSGDMSKSDCKICWQDFERGMMCCAPRLFFALLRVMVALIQPPGIDRSNLSSLKLDEIVAEINASSSASGPASSPVLPINVLMQLKVMLPSPSSVTSLSQLAFWDASNFSALEVLAAIGWRESPALLLVSGTELEPSKDIHEGDDLRHVLCGAYWIEPHEHDESVSATPSVLFTCEPWMVTTEPTQGNLYCNYLEKGEILMEQVTKFSLNLRATMCTHTCRGRSTEFKLESVTIYAMGKAVVQDSKFVVPVPFQ